eukprot:248804_1
MGTQTRAIEMLTMYSCCTTIFSMISQILMGTQTKSVVTATNYISNHSIQCCYLGCCARKKKKRKQTERKGYSGCDIESIIKYGYYSAIDIKILIRNTSLTPTQRKRTLVAELFVTLTIATIIEIFICVLITGGDGIYVAVFILLLDFDAKSAAWLSQATILIMKFHFQTSKYT